MIIDTFTEELPGYTEANDGPSSHVCHQPLVDTIINERQIILICYECRTYWHTGIVENTNNHPLGTLKLAAERIYRRRVA